MARWKVAVEKSVQGYVEVEAPSREDALDIMQGMCDRGEASPRWTCHSVPMPMNAAWQEEV